MSTAAGVAATQITGDNAPGYIGCVVLVLPGIWVWKRLTE